MAAVVVVVIVAGIVYLWSRVRDRYVETGTTVGDGAGVGYDATPPTP